MKNLLFILAAFFMFAACDSPGTDAQDDTQTDTTAVEEAPLTQYVITPFSESTSYPDATLKLNSFKNGKFNFNVSGGDYKLGVQTPDAPQKMCANSDKGQHIHLIIDNEPYAAKYEANFDYEIADGEHYMLAFLSRSYHESIKTDAAHLAQKITVKGNSLTSQEKITQPMLFYSRPKGDYIGKAETEKVMLDFYVVNAELGADYRVKMEVNGEFTTILDTWQPYYIEGLPMGDNRIKLTLLDAAGNPVNAPLNPVERVFTLKEDPAPGM